VAFTLRVVSVADEVPEIVPVPALVLVPVPDTDLAGRLSLRSGTDEVPALVQVPVTVLGNVRRQAR
jgi:hypothetical protein